MITENTVIVNGLRTRYLSGGPVDAEVIVFVHDGAWGGAADSTWGKVLPLAAEKYHVIAPDLLGFGAASKAIVFDSSPFAFRTDHLLALLDELGIDQPVHFIGSSFGGSVGLRALTNPAWVPRFASVTSLSGSGGPWRTEASAALGPFDGTREDIARITGLLVDDFEELEEHINLRHSWATTPGHYQAVMALHTAVPDVLKVERPADPYPANLEGVQTPVLLVHGELDPLIEPQWADELSSFMTNAQVQVTPYKHSPNISHPSETWALLDSFLHKVSR